MSASWTQWVKGLGTRGGTAHRSVQLLPSTVVPGLASFVGLVVIGHLAGLRMVGLVSLTRVGAAFGAAVLGEAPSLGALRSLSPGGADRSSAYRTAMLRRSALVVPVGVAAGLALAVQWPTIGEPILFGSLLVVAEALFTFEFALLRGHHRFGKASVLASSRSVVAWVVACAVAANSSSFAAVASAYVVTITLVGVILVVPRLSRVDEETTRDLRQTWRHLSSYNLATYALNNGDQYLLAMIAGPAAVGVYSLGYALGGGVIALFAEPFSGVLGPRIIREWGDEQLGPLRAMATARRGAVELLGGGLVLTAVIAVAGAAGLFSVVSSARALAPVAAIVAAASTVHSASLLESQSIVYLKGRTALLSRAAWITLAVALGVIIALTIVWTEVGTAVATLVAYALLGGLLWFYAHRR